MKIVLYHFTEYASFWLARDNIVFARVSIPSQNIWNTHKPLFKQVIISNPAEAFQFG